MLSTAGTSVTSQAAAVSSWQQCRHGNDDVMTTVTRRQYRIARRFWRPSSSWQRSVSSFYHTPSISSSLSTLMCHTKRFQPCRHLSSFSTWRCCRTSRWSATRSSTVFGCVDARQPVALSRRGPSTLTQSALEPCSVLVRRHHQWQVPSFVIAESITVHITPATWHLWPLTFDLLTLKVDRFTPLPNGPLVPSFMSKFIHSFL